MSRTYKDLAIAEEEGKLEEAIGKNRNLLVEAPTGSGKSLYIPWFLSRHSQGRVVVLQPRRIAALSLAQYSAKLHNEPCGKTIGYQFRQDTCKSAETRILFQTYGNFLQEILHGKLDAEWVVFDEYHERKADMDLLFAFLLKKNGPRIAVMSAKLNRSEMENALGVKCLELGHPLYPVQILHQTPATGAILENEVVRALKSLYRSGVWKTTLVFLPGKAEISKCHTAAMEALGNNCAEFLDLFGGQDRETQDRIFEETENPRVIFTTNIAETSITVPNVSGVVDSGVERISEYDDSENVNVLRTLPISMQNAIQRSGRSGRTQNGACIRLWSEETEKRMPQGIVPEITQIELSEFLLQKAALEKDLNSKLQLPTTLPAARAERSAKRLEKLEFIKDDIITESGLKAVRSPVTDVSLAFALVNARNQAELPDFLLAALAWIHSGTEFIQKSKFALDVVTLARDTLSKSISTPKEVSWTLTQLKDYRRQIFGNNSSVQSTSSAEDIRILTATLLKAYPDRLATPTSNGSYRLTNQNIVRLQATELPYALLAMSMMRAGTGSKSELRLSLYVPVPQEMLSSGSEEVRYELLWRNGQERFIGKEISGSGEREILPQEASPKVLAQLKELTVDAWREKLEKENWSGRYLTENLQVLLIKMKLAAKLYPEFSLPEFNEEDMELIFDEFTSGIFLLRDLNEDRYRNIIEEYFGKSMLAWLHKTFPDHFILPNGKKARYSYQEIEATEQQGGQPVQSADGVLVEISARIEDFMQSRGEHRIADGKIKVRYDILAPNFRTIQKTWDLTGFWQNTYIEVRKELRGRYPKHPWPEKVI